MISLRWRVASSGPSKIHLPCWFVLRSGAIKKKIFVDLLLEVNHQKNIFQSICSSKWGPKKYFSNRSVTWNGLSKKYFSNRSVYRSDPSKNIFFNLTLENLPVQSQTSTDFGRTNGADSIGLEIILFPKVNHWPHLLLAVTNRHNKLTTR